MPTPDDQQSKIQEEHQEESSDEAAESSASPNNNYSPPKHHECLAQLVRTTATSLSNLHTGALRAACRQTSELLGDVYIETAGAGHTGNSSISPDKDVNDGNHTVYKRDHFIQNLLTKTQEQHNVLLRIGSTGMEAKRDKFMRDVAEETLRQVTQATGTIIGNICCDTRHNISNTNQQFSGDGGGGKLLLSDTITPLKYRLIAIEEKNNELLEMGCSALRISCESRIEEAAKLSKLEIAYIEKNLDFERLKGELAAAYKVSESYDSQLANILTVCSKLAEETDALRDLPEKLAKEKRLNFLLEGHLKSVNEISVAVLKEKFEQYSRERDERKNSEGSRNVQNDISGASMTSYTMTGSQQPSSCSSVTTAYPSNALRKVSPDLFALKLLQHKKISISELVADWEGKYDTIAHLQNTIQSLNEEKTNTARLLSQAMTALAEERHRRTTTEKWCQQQLNMVSSSVHVYPGSSEGTSNRHQNLHLLYSDAQNEIVALKCRLVDAINENKCLKDKTNTLTKEIDRLKSEAKHSELIQAVNFAREQFSLDQRRLQMELADALGKLNQAEAVISEVTDGGNAAQNALLEAERSNACLVSKLAEAENKHIQLLGKIRQLELEAVNQAADTSTFALQVAQEQNYSIYSRSGDSTVSHGDVLDNKPLIEKRRVALGSTSHPQCGEGGRCKSDDFIRICQSSLAEMCKAVVALGQQSMSTVVSGVSEGNSMLAPLTSSLPSGTADIGEGQYQRAMEYMQHSLEKLLRFLLEQAKINDEVQREINDTLLLDMNTYRTIGEDLACCMKERDSLAIKVAKYEDIISKHALQATESLLLESSTASSSALRKIDDARELTSDATNTQSECTTRVIVNSEEIETLRQELDCANTENTSMRSAVKELEMKVSFLTSQQASNSIALEACQTQLSLYQDRLAAVREENASLLRSLKTKRDEEGLKAMESLGNGDYRGSQLSGDVSSSHEESHRHRATKEKRHRSDIVEDTRAVSPDGRHLVHITKLDVAYDDDDDDDDNEPQQCKDTYPVEQIICEEDDESSEEEECINSGSPDGPRFVVKVARDDDDDMSDTTSSEAEMTTNVTDGENDEYNDFDDNDDEVVGGDEESQVLPKSATSFIDQVRLIRNAFQTLEAALAINDATVSSTSNNDLEINQQEKVEGEYEKNENCVVDDDDGADKSEIEKAVEILDTHLESQERKRYTNENPTTALTNMLTKAQEAIISAFAIAASGETPTPDTELSNPSQGSSSVTVPSIPLLFQTGKEIRAALENCNKHITTINPIPEISPEYFQLEAEKKALEEQIKKAKPLANMLLEQKKGLETQVSALTQILVDKEKEIESLKINMSNSNTGAAANDDAPSLSVRPTQSQNQSNPQAQKQQLAPQTSPLGPIYTPTKVPPKAIPAKSDPVITTAISVSPSSNTSIHGAGNNPVITPSIQKQPSKVPLVSPSFTSKGTNDNKHPPQGFKKTKKAVNNKPPQPKRQPFFAVGTTSESQKEPVKQPSSIFGNKGFSPTKAVDAPPPARMSAFAVLPMTAAVGNPPPIIPSPAVLSSPDTATTLYSGGKAQATSQPPSSVLSSFGSANSAAATQQLSFGIPQQSSLASTASNQAVQRQQAQSFRQTTDQQQNTTVVPAPKVPPAPNAGSQLGKGAAAAFAALRARKAGQK